MEWLLGLAFVPILLCGLMCVVPMILAAVGLRRATDRRACCDQPSHRAHDADPREMPAAR